MDVTEEMKKGCDFCTEGNWAEAMKIFTRLAKKGVREAQFNLGLMFADGCGVDRDFKKAAKWYAKSADQDMVEAQVNLGALYCEGIGVKKDLAKAYALFESAANNGYALGQFRLGLMYENGWNVEQDFVWELSFIVVLHHPYPRLMAHRLARNVRDREFL